ncbi:MAG: ATP-grasp domain-containing protein [Cellulophaga sp.]
MKSNKVRVLIPDAEWEILTNHVKNCFSTNDDVELYLMSNRKDTPNRFSRFIAHFSYYPKTDIASQWIKYINIEVEKFRIDFILPIYEHGIRTLIEHKGLLEDSSKLGLMPTLLNFDTANNKKLLAAHLYKNSIPTPVDYAIGDDNYEFPIIVKPVEGEEGGSGIHVFQEKEAFAIWLQKEKNDKKYLIQKYVEGYDIDCSVLCKDGEIKGYTIQKGVLYSRKKYSPAIGLEFLHEKELFKVVKKLMKSLSWSGIAHVDLRYDESDKQFKVIEINTRFWGSLDASLIAGVNFPYLYYLLSKGRSFVFLHYKLVSFLSLKGLMKRIRQQAGFITKFNYIVGNTSFRYVIKDPVPFFVKVLLILKTKFSSKD